MIRFLFSVLLCVTFLNSSQSQDESQPKYLDPNLSFDLRVQDLIGRLTLAEKASLMVDRSPGVPRLNIPEYNWWNEGLHGVGRSGVATIFPQAIGLGATFDEDLVYKIATAIGDEARAMYNITSEKGYRLRYNGLTFWSPNVNIFRDPRWGRGQETFGEDPFLVSTLGVSFVSGMQGDDPKYLKVAACAKHFAVHSGPEKLRHEFNAVASKKDMFETYLPAFKALVETQVEAVMCAYNKTNGEACCAHNYLIEELLRNTWAFKGHVVSDCGAIADLYKEEAHHVVETEQQAAALAVKSGVNLNCGRVYPALVGAVEEGLITEEEIDQSLATLLKTWFKLGLFDPKEIVSYSQLTSDVINSPKHRQLAREAALKSVVLLKNNGVLPLKNDLPKYFITGPTAADIDAMLGNYFGVNNNIATILEGIAGAVAPGSQLQYKPGVLLDRANVNPNDWASGNAEQSDATFMVMGISGLIEGEEGESIASPYFGDRLDYNLPVHQIDYLKKLKHGHDRPVIAIVTGGSPMNLQEVHNIADAVLLIWYPGEEGGNAVADILFGKEAPSGRLPVTFPKSLDQLPPYEDYSMHNRTYKYMKEDPQYPFGFGLSYTSFEYDQLTLSSSKLKRKSKEPIEVQLKVTNIGAVEATEVVQLYVTDLEASVEVPLYTLKGIKKVALPAGESTMVKFQLTADQLKIVDNAGKYVLEPGQFKISVGGSLPSSRSLELGAAKPVSTLLVVK